MVAGVCHRLSSVTLNGGPAGGFTRAGQAMTSCRLQSNYSSTEIPVRAIPGFNTFRFEYTINIKEINETR